MNSSGAALEGRRALVTGASRGIGRATALALASAGADVVVHYNRQSTAAADACAEIVRLGRRAVALSADVSQPAACERLVREAEAALGPLDVLVNNAGVARPVPVGELTLEHWREALEVNLTSSFVLTQAVLPGMRARRWGRIVMVSSIAAQVGGVVGPHYAASKAGMIGLMHGYARLLSGEGITVNAVAPALIDTDMVRDNPNARPDIVPLGRFGTADETAQAIVLLATNGYMTGQTVGVNGGWYMTS